MNLSAHAMHMHDLESVIEHGFLKSLGLLPDCQIGIEAGDYHPAEPCESHRDDNALF